MRAPLRLAAAAVVLSLVAASACQDSGPFASEAPRPARPPGDGLAVEVVHHGPVAPLAGAIPAQVVFRQDLLRTGFIAGAEVPDRMVLDWELAGLNPNAHSAAKGSAAVVPVADARGRIDPARTRIVVGGDSGLVHCLTAEGELLWSAPTALTRFGTHSTPAVHDGRVYIGAYDGVMYAFALEDGRELWHTQIADSIGSSPLVHDGKVFVSVETREFTGVLAILDAQTGEILWRDDELRGHPHSSVALDPERNIMVVGDNAGDLIAWDVNGASAEDPPVRRWRITTGGAIKGPILVHDGAAFFGSWDHHVYRVELADGEIRWRFRTGNLVMSGAALDPERAWIFIGGHDSHLYALEAATGELVWRYPAGGRIIGSPTVAGDKVLVGSSDGALHALERASGRPVFVFRARGHVSSSPAVLGNRVIFTERRSEAAGAPGSLYVLGPPP